MTSQHGIEGLRVDVPTLEPDAVLLAQLVELSSASAPPATTSRAPSMKVLLAAAGAAVVATTTWAAGAVPGNPFPSLPAHHRHAVASPTASPSGERATRTPGASDPRSKAPGSIHPTPDGPHDSTAPGAWPTALPSGTRPMPGHTGHSRTPGKHRHHLKRRAWWSTAPHDGRDRDPRWSDQRWSDHGTPTGGGPRTGEHRHGVQTDPQADPHVGRQGDSRTPDTRDGGVRRPRPGTPSGWDLGPP